MMLAVIVVAYEQRGSVVTLADVDESTLERLVAAAVTDAAADDVTPPVTLGEDWSAGRIVWLKDFHRARRGTAGRARTRDHLGHR